MLSGVVNANVHLEAYADFSVYAEVYINIWKVCAEVYTSMTSPATDTPATHPRYTLLRAAFNCLAFDLINHSNLEVDQLKFEAPEVNWFCFQVNSLITVRS